MLHEVQISMISNYLVVLGVILIVTRAQFYDAEGHGLDPRLLSFLDAFSPSTQQ